MGLKPIDCGLLMLLLESAERYFLYPDRMGDDEENFLMFYIFARYRLNNLQKVELADIIHELRLYEEETKKAQDNSTQTIHPS